MATTIVAGLAWYFRLIAFRDEREHEHRGSCPLNDEMIRHIIVATIAASRQSL